MENPKELDELLAKVSASVKRTNRNFIIVGLIILGLAVLMVVAIFTDPTFPPALKIVGWLFVAGLLALDYLMVKKVFGPNPLVEYLRSQPGKIIEVEAIRINYKSGIQTYQKNLHFKVSDGQNLVLSDNRRYIEELEPLLKKHLKQAKFNF